MRTLHLISGRGRWDAKALAEELECSQRTVHRMLATLSMAGVPWHFDEKVRAYRVREGFRFPLVEQPIFEEKKIDAPANAPSDFQATATELIEHGEAFARSLDRFLETLRSQVETETDEPDD
ncbi:HTH domain-containing protein [Novipirellula rosea]